MHTCNVYAPTDLCTYTHARSHTHMDARIHTHTHARTHTHTQRVNYTMVLHIEKLDD